MSSAIYRRKTQMRTQFYDSEIPYMDYWIATDGTGSLIGKIGKFGIALLDRYHDGAEPLLCSKVEFAGVDTVVNLEDFPLSKAKVRQIHTPIPQKETYYAFADFPEDIERERVERSASGIFFKRKPLWHEIKDHVRLAVLDLSFYTDLQGPYTVTDFQPVFLETTDKPIFEPQKTQFDANHGARATSSASRSCGRAKRLFKGSEGTSASQTTRELKIKLFQMRKFGGTTNSGMSSYLGPVDLSLAILQAVGEENGVKEEYQFKADVVLIPLCDGMWGTRNYLRDILRASARQGRDNKGAVIVFSAGDQACNRNHEHYGAAIGADDPCSQPWSIAVGACDKQGQWLRREVGESDDIKQESERIAISRFGPSVLVSASGEIESGDFGMDDTSRAASHVAGTVSAILQHNEALTQPEIVQLLSWTALQCQPPVDKPSKAPPDEGMLSRVLNGRDRLGHSLKVGYGLVNTELSCLGATDPLALSLILAREVPEDVEAFDAKPFCKVAVRWSDMVEENDSQLARMYKDHRGLIVRGIIRSISLREQFCWIARHLLAVQAYGFTTASQIGEYGVNQPSDWKDDENHGTIVKRLSYIIEDLLDDAWLESELPAAMVDQFQDERVSQFLNQLRKTIDSDKELVVSIFKDLVSEATVPVTENPMSIVAQTAF